MYLYFPPIPKHSPYKRCSVTVLLDRVDREAVERILEESGLEEMARERQLILAFPDPGPGGWDYERDPEVIGQLQGAMTTEREIEPVQTYFGIPTPESMLSSWHLMNDTRYLIGIGEKGAAMALTMAACCPANVAAVMTMGGSLPEAALKKAVYSPVPVWLCGADAQTVSYFISAGGARKVSEKRWACPVQPLQCVELHPEAELTSAFLNRVWDEFFRKVRRTNTGRCGNVVHRTDIGEYGGEYFIENTQLGDQENMPHTWLTFVPQCVRDLPEGEKAPLMIFYHGGSDNPTEAAEMARFHEIGEKEGFITVYPWGSNRCSWNIFMNEDEPDDVAFSEALIRYMIAQYPVDPSRVYLSGFSNGSSQAMVTAMVHPELIAAICPIDGNWPGERIGPSEVDYEQIRPMALARQIRKTRRSHGFHFYLFFRDIQGAFLTEILTVLQIVISHQTISQIAKQEVGGAVHTQRLEEQFFDHQSCRLIFQYFQHTGGQFAGKSVEETGTGFKGKGYRSHGADLFPKRVGTLFPQRLHGFIHSDGSRVPGMYVAKEHIVGQPTGHIHDVLDGDGVIGGNDVHVSIRSMHHFSRVTVFREIFVQRIRHQKASPLIKHHQRGI